MTSKEIIKKFSLMADQTNIEGMARFGINADKAFGIRMPEIRKISSGIKRDNNLAKELWESGFHEARILASMVADASGFDEVSADKWANDFDSWDVCDQCCLNLFVNADFREKKIHQWCISEKEFVRRASFALIAVSAVHLKKIPDESFLEYLPLIEQYSSDGRNFVKKAVNWALRQIGKRSMFLNANAIAFAENLALAKNSSAKWIASDAIRELKDEKILYRIKK